MRWYIRYVYLFAFFLLHLFCFSLLTVSNVSALDDVVKIIDNSNYSSADTNWICDDSSSVRPHCSDFSFLIIENIGPSFPRQDSGPVIRGMWGGLGSFSPIIVSLSSSSFIGINGWQGMSGYDWSSLQIRFTLTDSLSGGDCPVCEECQVCPAISENPYDDKFDKIITAIYVCAATILVVYFFYCIYRMIIKSSGGF